LTFWDLLTVSPDVLIKYDVTIDGGRRVFLDQNATIQSLTIGSSSELTTNDAAYTLTVRNVINNNGTFRKAGGTGITTYTIPFNNAGTVEVLSGTLGLSGGGTNSNGNYVVASGTTMQLTSGIFTFEGMNTVSGSGTLTLAGGSLAGEGSITNSGPLEWSGGTMTDAGSFTNTSNDFTITGTVEKYVSGGRVLNNSGTVRQVGSVGVRLLSSGATVNNLAGGVWDFQGDGWMGGDSTSGPRAINNAGTIRKSSGTGTTTLGSNGSGATFSNTGMIEVNSGTLSFERFTQTAGSADLNGGNLTFSSAAQILGGEILGSGTINGSVVNSGGLVSPGHSVGSMIINGNYTQGETGALLFEFAGVGGGQFDFLDLNGTASLDGILEIAFINGFHPVLGDAFHIMDFNSRTGDFDAHQVLGASGYQFTPQYTGGSLTLITRSVPEPSTIVMAFTGLVCLLLLVGRHRQRT